MLALSSLSKSRRFVAIMYAGIIFFTAAMYQALSAITGSRAWAWISPRTPSTSSRTPSSAVPDPPPMPVPVALLTVVAC